MALPSARTISHFAASRPQVEETLVSLRKKPFSSLSLDCTELVLDDVVQITDACGRNGSLQKLSLRSCGLDHQASGFLARVLSSTVLELDFRWNSLGSGVTSFGRYLLHNTSLVQLHLAKNKITDEGAIALANALLKHPTLKHLGLQDNLIGPEGIKAFLPLLKENPVLTELHMSGNSINPPVYLETMLSLQDNLTILNLTLPSLALPALEDHLPLHQILSRNKLLTSKSELAPLTSMPLFSRNSPPKWNMLDLSAPRNTKEKASGFHVLSLPTPIVEEQQSKAPPVDNLGPSWGSEVNPTFTPESLQMYQQKLHKIQQDLFEENLKIHSHLSTQTQQLFQQQQEFTLTLIANEREQLERKFEKKQQTLTQVNDHLQSEIMTFEKKVQIYEQEGSALRQIVKTKQALLDEQTTKVNELEKAVREKKLKKKLAELENQIAELQSANDVLRVGQFELEEKRDVDMKAATQLITLLRAQISQNLDEKLRARSHDHEFHSPHTNQAPDCIVCSDAPVAVAFVPCGHFCSCSTCSEFFTDCPVCRRAVTSKQRIYM